MQKLSKLTNTLVDSCNNTFKTQYSMNIEFELDLTGQDSFVQSNLTKTRI